MLNELQAKIVKAAIAALDQHLNSVEQLISELSHEFDDDDQASDDDTVENLEQAQEAMENARDNLAGCFEDEIPKA